MPRRSQKLYALVWSAARERLRDTSAIVLGSLMHATGHSFLAAAAGLLAGSLAGSRVGSTPAWFARFTRDAASGESAMMIIAIAAVFAAIAKLVGGALSSWGEAQIAGNVAAKARLSLLDDVLAVHVSRHTRHNDHGSKLAALTTHIHDIENGVAHGVLAEARALVQLVPLTVLLIVLAPRLAGSAVIALGSFAVLAFSLRRAFKRANARAAKSAGALVSAADEAVRHAELWATYGAKRRIRSHVEKIGRAIALEAARIRVRASLLSSTSEVLGAIALVLVLILASKGTLGVDHLTVVPFAIAFFMAYKPLRDLVDARIARSRGEQALREAHLLLPRSDDDDDADDVPAITPIEAKTWPLAPLVIDSACALHGEHEPLSIIIPPGKIAAIVGSTGVGKTSLLRALLGLESLRSGSIRYGDDTLDDDAGIGPHARPFAWVPQDAPIVGDTLAINIGLARADDHDADDVDAIAALVELGGEPCERLAKSIDANELLGTRRVLSGGERQWINVARALATGLPVLLLDEPTSALDPEAQSRLLEAIARLRGKRTVILVTHRPEPLAIADVIVRLEASSSQLPTRGSGIIKMTA